ncbi:glycogen/starch synthase [Streptomyces avermitilis]|uniref:glycogen synthase n=1 Tax=Streptomyces avermitilis TaxID=33903 RepID=UPI0033AF2AFC
MRCLYITQEYAPLFTEGGLGLTSRFLPAALQSEYDVTHDLVLPYYPWLIKQGSHRTEEICRLSPVSIASRETEARILRLLGHGGPCEVYLVRADPWYDRGGIYRDEEYTEFGDAAERAAFFGSCVAQWVRGTGDRYDLVHANDWQSGAALAQLAVDRGTARRPALLMNIHSAEYPGLLDGTRLDALGLPAEAVAALRREPGEESLLLLGLLSADASVTCSPGYAAGLAKEFAGTGIGRVLADLPLSGIVSGVDPEVWNPAADGRPSLPFDPADPRSVDTGKRRNKRALQHRLGLPVNDSVPVLGVCSRVVRAKGTDALLDGLRPILRTGRVQLVLVGPAEPGLRAECEALAAELPDAMVYVPRFDQETAWLVYAGSDFTVMPSRAEPCGLNQLIAMAYGTLPLVTPVGGLLDTVTDLRTAPADGTGFFIPEPTGEAVRQTVLSALDWLRDDPQAVAAARGRALAQDWSWSRTAAEFTSLYAQLTGGLAP